MLADDVDDLRDLMRIGLEIDGRFEVVGEARDGAEAVDIADQTRPDIALVDIAMPVMDGLQAIPEIHRVSPSTRVAVMSGFQASKMRDHAISLSAEAYIEKGTTTEELCDALAGLWDSPPK